MATSKSPLAVRREYYEAAQGYLGGLAQEYFMESLRQGTQRKISLFSLEMVSANRPEVQVFNKLLVQYPKRPTGQISQVIPDNMVVIHPTPIRADGSYDIPSQPVRPFWMLEYVSPTSRRKDYDDHFQKYEHDLKVPYCLIFYPDLQELSLYRRGRKGYVSVKPNAQGRLEIPELEIEVALLERWARFWYKGELIPLPADLLREMEQLRRELDAARGERDAAYKERDEATRRAIAAEEEIARLRAELDRIRKP